MSGPFDFIDFEQLGTRQCEDVTEFKESRRNIDNYTQIYCWRVLAEYQYVLFCSLPSITSFPKMILIFKFWNIAPLGFISFIQDYSAWNSIEALTILKAKVVEKLNSTAGKSFKLFGSALKLDLSKFVHSAFNKLGQENKVKFSIKTCLFGYSLYSFRLRALGRQD